MPSEFRLGNSTLPISCGSLSILPENTKKPQSDFGCRMIHPGAYLEHSRTYGTFSYDGTFLRK